MHEVEFHFFLNGVNHTSHHQEITPEEILRIGGFAPDEYKLVRVKKPDEELLPGVPVRIENGEKFLALKKSNPFSDITGMADIEQFIVERLALKVEYVKGGNGDNLVMKDFEIPAGSLAGKKCDLALPCTNSVPFNPHAYFHTRPALVPNDSVHGTQAGKVSPDWQYWSRQWSKPPRGPEEVWAWILTALTDAA